MPYPYPSLDDAREQLPVALAMLRGQMPEANVGAKAVYVTSGYGLSMYPGEPGVFGAEAPCEAPANYGNAEAAADLEAHFDQTFGAAGPAKAVPWLKIAQLLLALLPELLAK